MKNVILTALFCVSTFALTAVAQTPEEQLESAQASVKATFKNLTFTEFKESPIPGIYELNAGGKIIYFEPEKEYLIFGEIFNKEGKSITQQSLFSARKDNPIDDLLEYAVVIGDENASKTIVEFTDPDCPYCRSYDRWINDHESSSDVKRLVFFDTRLHDSTARPKAIHILCSDNPQAEMKKIFLGIQPSQFNTCDKAQDILKMHASAVVKVGVSGTPSFLLDGNLTVGFRKSTLNNYITQ